MPKGHGQGNGKPRKHHGPRLGRLIKQIGGDVGPLLNIGGDLHQPPSMSYDPAIEAERRAAARGLLDTRQDTKIALKQGRQDLHTTLKDLALNLKRTRQDERRGLRRGLQNVQFQRQDARRSAFRGRQDLGLQMDALVRKFGTQGQVQAQAANAAGVYDAGTLASASAKRAANLAFERQPIDIGMQRIGQDLRIALGRSGVEAQRLRQDYRRNITRARQDTRHDKRLARRDFKRTKKSLFIDLDRASREQRIGNVDLTQQEIFDARARHPGVYGKKGRK